MASLFAVAGLTVTVLEVALARLPLVKVIVMASALSYRRLEKVATPLAAVAVVVPPNKAVPVPVVRAAVTTVELTLVARFPNASSSFTTVDEEKAAPAVAVLGGWV